MPWLKSPLTQIVGLALVMTAVQPILAVVGWNGPLPAGLMLAAILSYALPITIVQWIAADMRDHRRTPCFDFCFLMLLAWPLSLFWYTISTRGWSGLLLALGLLALT